MEHAARACAEHLLPAGSISVGTHPFVKHCVPPRASCCRSTSAARDGT
jgi:predicted thioesterase